MTRKEAESYRAKIEMAAALMSDEAALDSIELIAPWRIKEYVNAGDRRRFNGVLYKCVQAHTTQADWTPDTTKGNHYVCAVNGNVYAPDVNGWTLIP